MAKIDTVFRYSAFRRVGTSVQDALEHRNKSMTGFHFGLMDRISPFGLYWMGGFPLTIWGFPPSDFLLDGFPLSIWGSGFLRIFIRLGEDDGWMVDGGWCI
ncbi:unnamed protein product [Rhizophagus irregularis]|nr:unnamed protein product [Rhizophagus irregularis]